MYADRTSLFCSLPQGPVFTLLCRDGYLLSGGRDGILHCWNINDMETAGFLQVLCSFSGIDKEGI